MSALARCSAVETSPGVSCSARRRCGSRSIRTWRDRQPADVDAGDAGGALEPLLDDLVGEQRQLARAALLAEQRQVDRRLGVVAVEARDVRLLGVAREARLHDRDLVADVLDGAVHVGRDLELDHRLAAPFERVRADHLDAGDAVERELDRPRQLGLDRLGRGAGVGDDDEDDRRRDVGQPLDAQLAVREQAEDAERRHHHRREDGVGDRDAGEPHGRSFAGGAVGYGKAGRARSATPAPPTPTPTATIPAGADGAPDAALATLRCATTLAGAPSLRLSKRTARICASAAEPLDDLDAAGRRVAPSGDDDAAHQRALLDRPDEILPRRLADGAARHRHPLGRVGELDARLRVLAGAEALALVLERDDDADRARPGFGRRRDAVDAARDVAALPFDADRRDLARLEHRHLVRADRSGQLERREVDDGDDLLLGADLLAGHDVALADDAGDRHGKRRVANADAHRGELRLRRPELGARRVEARLRRLQGGRRDEVLRRQADVGGVLPLGLDQRRLRRFDQGGTVFGAALHLGEVDHPDHLAGLDAAAFGDAEREQRPRRLGAYDRRARRDQRPGELERQRQPRGDRPRDLGGDELERDRHLLVLVAAAQNLGQHGGRDRGEGDRHDSTDPDPAFRLVGGGRTFSRNLHGRECRTAVPRHAGDRATDCQSGGPGRRRPRQAASRPA